MSCDVRPRRVLAVSWPFAYGLVDGFYEVEQRASPRLISPSRLPEWVYIYCNVTTNKSLASHTDTVLSLARKAGVDVPDARGVIVGAVLFREVSSDFIRQHHPTLPLLKGAVQRLLVEDKVAFPVPVALDLRMPNGTRRRHDRWLTLPTGTLRDLGSLFASLRQPSYPETAITITYDGVHFQSRWDPNGTIVHTASTIAKHFGLRPSSLYLVLSHSLLPRVDAVHFQLPSYVLDSEFLQLEAQGELMAEHDEDEINSCSSSSSAASVDGLVATVFDCPKNQRRYDYLVFGKVPQDNSKAWRQNVRRRYFIRDGHLMIRKQQSGHYKSVPRRVRALLDDAKIVMPTKDAMLELVADWHRRAHDGRDRLLSAIGNHYHYHGLKELIQSVVGECDTCQAFDRTIKPVSQAIITEAPLEIVMMDVTTMPMFTPTGNKHILLMIDHFTKYKWAKPLPSKEAQPCADWLLEVFRERPVPRRFHCDNGSEFVNAAMQQVYKTLGGPMESHGRPRNPKCQGLVERANQTVKTKLIKRCVEDDYTQAGQTYAWEEDLAEIILQDNDAPIALYGGISAFLALNRAPRHASSCRILSNDAANDLYEHMKQCQLTRAGKRCQYPELQPIQVGSVVRVRATRKELIQHKAIAAWSIRAVVHSLSAQSTDYFKLRWLSQGPSAGASGASREPGSISTRHYGRHDLRLVEKDSPLQVLCTMYYW